MKVSTTEPGVVVSGALHGAVLLAALIAFSTTRTFDEAQESVPVDIVTDQQFNDVMKGEKTAPPAPRPVARAQKQAEVDEAKPDAPQPAERDVPVPPSPLKRLVDPGEADAPKEPAKPERVAALPPARPVDPDPPKEPAPVPEPRPPLKSVVEPPPPDAEAAEAKPTPPSRPEVKKDVAALPPVKPKAADKPKDDPKKPDAVAKLLDKSAPVPDRPAVQPTARPKSGEADVDPQKRLDLASISKLLSKDQAQQRASTGQQLSRVASLGSPTASAARMSPSLWGQLDGLLQDQYKSCWSYLGLDSSQRYVPQIKVQFMPDGTLSGQPSLLNPPSDPAMRSLADSAMRAVRRCNPLKIPAQFTPYYEQWKGRILRFDPEEMAG